MRYAGWQMSTLRPHAWVADFKPVAHHLTAYRILRHNLATYALHIADRDDGVGAVG